MLAAHGVGDGLVRRSIGLESVEDIAADIGEALDTAQHAPPRRAS